MSLDACRLEFLTMLVAGKKDICESRGTDIIIEDVSFSAIKGDKSWNSRRRTVLEKPVIKHNCRRG